MPRGEKDACNVASPIWNGSLTKSLMQKSSGTVYVREAIALTLRKRSRRYVRGADAMAREPLSYSHATKYVCSLKPKEP